MGGRPIAGLVFFGGQPICDDFFDSREARVVCRMAGWHDMKRYHKRRLVGQSDFVLVDLECNGYESSLLQCPHRGLNRHNCGRSEGVFVECCMMGECNEPTEKPTRQPTRRPTRRPPSSTYGAPDFSTKSPNKPAVRSTKKPG